MTNTMTMRTNMTRMLTMSTDMASTRTVMNTRTMVAVTRLTMKMLLSNINANNYRHGFSCSMVFENFINELSLTAHSVDDVRRKIATLRVENMVDVKEGRAESISEGDTESVNSHTQHILNDSVWFSSTMKKRRAKMNKHKLRKRNKKLRFNTKPSRR